MAEHTKNHADGSPNGGPTETPPRRGTHTQARLISPEQSRALRERQAEAFRDLARRSEGLVKYAHLQHAIEIAETYGLRDLANDLRLETEAIAEDELGLQVISSEVEIPRERVDDFIGRFVGDDDLTSALVRFGSYVPSGDPSDTQRFVDDLMARHPLQFLFTRLQIGPHNSLIRSTQGQDEQVEHALLEHEVQLISMFSLFAVDILRQIRDRYGALHSAAGWFESELIEPQVASKIGRAMELFESGDFDSAAAILAPRLERVIRRIAAAVGLPVTRSADRGGRSGGVRGLGELVAALDGAIPASTRRYLRALLSEPAGMNLRNRVGHGLDDEFTQREAALLIHAVCHLRLMTRGDRTSSETA